MASWLFLGKDRLPLIRSLIRPRWETGGNRFASIVPVMLSADPRRALARP